MTTYNSILAYTGDGVTTRWVASFPGGFLDPTHVFVRIDGTLTTAVIEGTNTVAIEPALASGQEFTIERITPADVPLVDFTDGAGITEENLDDATRQGLFVASEARDTLLGFKDRAVLGPAGADPVAVGDIADNEGEALVILNGQIATLPFDAGTLAAVLADVIARQDVLDNTIATAELPYAVIAVNDGQSLAVERTDGGTITTTTLPKGKMFVGGDHYDNPGVSSPVANNMVKIENVASIVDWQQRSGYEGWGGGTIAVHGEDKNATRVLFYCSAKGGFDLESTSRGTPCYMSGAMAINAFAKDVENNEGRIVGFFRASRWEADADTIAKGGGTSEAAITDVQTVEGIKLWIAERTRDWKRATRNMESSRVFFIDAPLNSGSHYEEGGWAAQKGQLDAAKAGIMTLGLVRYQLYDNWSGDLIHPDTLQYRLYAEGTALIEQRLLSGGSYIPQHIESIERSGDTITVKYVKPVVIDEVNIPAHTNYPGDINGFMLFEPDNRTVNPLTSVTKTGSRELTITASGITAGSILRYAQQPYPVGTTKVTSWLERGQIRSDEVIGQSTLLVDDEPFTFRDFAVAEQKVV